MRTSTTKDFAMHNSLFTLRKSFRSKKKPNRKYRRFNLSQVRYFFLPRPFSQCLTQRCSTFRVEKSMVVLALCLLVEFMVSFISDPGKMGYCNCLPRACQFGLKLREICQLASLTKVIKQTKLLCRFLQGIIRGFKRLSNRF